ncbi:transposase [Pseudomonas mohnii]|uniref:transposase n=1 Tax=Pseudomonas mohnii TaxID=395600 RepID=UPI0018C57433|nr:transposase [Pseudomonas mohnii]MBH8610923.1 transposase [Pseudomonas mohnii]
MKKYTEQAKLSVVEDYCSGSAGHREVAHRHGVNANVIRKWLPIYRDKPVAPLPAFVPLQPMPKRQADEAVVIALSLGDKSITVKWPISDPDGCARFIRSLSQ